MTLLPFEEFMKSITPVVQDKQNIEDMNDCKRFTDVLVKEISKITFNHIECYHNWLAKQLEDNNKSTETNTDTE